MISDYSILCFAIVLLWIHIFDSFWQDSAQEEVNEEALEEEEEETGVGEEDLEEEEDLVEEGDLEEVTGVEEEDFEGVEVVEVSKFVFVFSLYMWFWCCMLLLVMFGSYMEIFVLIGMHIFMYTRMHKYVTLDHKTSHMGTFFKIDNYTSPESFLNIWNLRVQKNYNFLSVCVFPGNWTHNLLCC